MPFVFDGNWETTLRTDGISTHTMQLTYVSVALLAKGRPTDNLHSICRLSLPGMVWHSVTIKRAAFFGG